ncbi:thioredoxin family protein [Tundrisphaera sp. TA3]|uniref:thioredoxin family protein n=1 Tax=Tundrisphaera sp. TA3 TaxID=3435775 RepID=UPI003EBFF98B
MDWTSAFDAALPYDAFLDRHASPSQRARWDALHARVRLSADQATLLGGFVRRMPVLVMAGTWCGDCVNQCPFFDHFARATPVLDVRFVDRDALPEVAAELRINDAARVPHAVFLNEDFQEVFRFGEKTLSIYRRLAVEQLGASCPTGIVPPSDEALATSMGEWLDQFERAQLILRLSTRLRERHCD